MHKIDYGSHLNQCELNLPAQVIQHSHVCIHIVEVVRIRWVVLLCPVDWQWAVHVEDVLLWLRFIIHAVKTNDLREETKSRKNLWGSPERSGIYSVQTWYMLKEEVEIRVASRVDCSLKQGHEDVLQHFLEIGQLSLCMVDVTLRRKWRLIKNLLSFKEEQLHRKLRLSLFTQFFLGNK